MSDKAADHDEFRSGLEIGIRAADLVWKKALNSERTIGMAGIRARRELADLLDKLQEQPHGPKLFYVMMGHGHE